MEVWQKNFIEVATGIAFQISLSKAQCDHLMRIKRGPITVDFNGRTWEKMERWNYSTLTALERRGLVGHDGDGYRITKAGEHVAELVQMAFANTMKENYV